MIAALAKAIHIWDLRMIARQLADIGLHDELLSFLQAEGPAPRTARSVEIVANVAAAAQLAVEQQSRTTIARYRTRHGGEPG